MLLCLCTTSMLADDFINLTPRPRNMVEGKSTLTLPASFTVGYTNLPADMVTEVERFVTVFTTAGPVRNMNEVFSIMSVKSVKAGE